jgi:NAD(P)-dependent dehydrogenase (short-subunit alcohol dehydrogenase family)
MKKQNSMDDIHGKAALVSGASRGIGRAVAATLVRAGADVAINYFSSEKEAMETLLWFARRDSGASWSKRMFRCFRKRQK